MLHRINAFLYGTPPQNEQQTFDRVRQHFADDNSVQFETKELPFDRGHMLKLTVKGYWINVSYITEDIEQRIEQIEANVGTLTHKAIKPYCEVRTLFGPDEHANFYPYTVKMHQFLEALPNAVVYDEDKHHVISASI